jgi:hypothetical protein
MGEKSNKKAVDWEVHGLLRFWLGLSAPFPFPEVFHNQEGGPKGSFNKIFKPIQYSIPDIKSFFPLFHFLSPYSKVKGK